MSDNTRRTYAKPQASFRTFCARAGVPALPVTEANLANFLAHLATQTKLLPATIKTYRSAINTMHAESEFGTLPGAAESAVVNRVIKGIARERTAVEKAARAARRPTTDLTPDLLATLAPCATDSAPQAIMLWAAVCTGTHGTLRVSELIGSSQNPERALRPEQIVFRDAARRVVPHVGASTGVATPASFDIRLRETKTDQMALFDQTATVAAPIAVSALWRWVALRRADCPTLFEQRLKFPAIGEYLRSLCEKAGLGRPHFSGKCFRRGGASGALASGASREDIAAAGRWKSHAMIDLYANSAAKEARALKLSAALGRV